MGTAVVPFLPLTILGALITWTTAAAPAAVLRKVFLTPTRTPATSPSTSVKASLSKSSTTNAFVVYAFSAAIAAALHVFLAYAYDSSRDAKLGLFVKSKKHPYYLNGRLLFILLSQLSLALGFSLRNITLDRFVFSWSLVASSSNRKSTRFSPSENVIKAIAVAAVFTTLTVPFSAVIFGLARMTLPAIYQLPLLHYFLRPFTAHFLRGSWTIFLPFRHLALLSRAWFLGFTTIFTWELSNGLFDTFIYQPVIVAQVTPDPHVTLVSGISSSDLAFRYFAYTELKTLAAEQSPAAVVRRTSLFSDQKHNPSPWAHLFRESLLFLGKDYQYFLNRGKPAAPKPEVKKVPTPSTSPPIKVTQVPLIRTSIFQSGKPSSPIRSVVESLGSDGALAQALDAGAEAAHIPELFRTVEDAVLSEPAKAEVKKSVEKATGVVEQFTNQAKAALHGAYERFAPTRAARFGERLGRWWRKDRLGRVVQGHLPNMEMDVVIVEVLSHLICASLTEDKYGVVQRDIPRVLEAMISFLAEIEKYQKEVRGMYAPPALDKTYTPEEFEELEALRIEVEKASDILGYVGDGMKEGIARIVRTFGDKLLAFKFPTRIAQKLQPFLEYC
ncbi:Nucleoporin NDC1 [Hypsizygus marmoreus]|uniref:Nucleoporin NDC1 n=1 Tax=Hypsizygus marmoreus TaxID=39966 RepID=A0A369JA37_HYPMA|nr:Nucleoporin NDC1 [Hypsizygus marmoreus]